MPDSWSFILLRISQAEPSKPTTKSSYNVITHGEWSTCCALIKQSVATSQVRNTSIFLFSFLFNLQQRRCVENMWTCSFFLIMHRGRQKARRFSQSQKAVQYRISYCKDFHREKSKRSTFIEAARSPLYSTQWYLLHRIVKIKNEHNRTYLQSKHTWGDKVFINNNNFIFVWEQLQQGK